ncbi:hypothetical protein BEP19_16015 [Ammoniphilus oxalaticus]|uniref:Uncharacterized protein n=1 Tax=Ammoniphilus oxalaticus TaxID=66863 RepID=A0A419SQI8_9BACL|nr:hypothetical protein [Ammoniphilus oxalaticus]RKD26709.1 hypothetical protein BEP19_16015 [Ammoniphilus oxalaticus]
MGQEDITRRLLIAQMERAIELLNEDATFVIADWDSDKNRAELKNKLHEIRRDSIRLSKWMEGK